ncbi:DUF1648 domain-containing protein [uncultured Senegalimassilia sp.]|uniref:DUF1648 domain-containing protein n=1 Tax=uncultured Senegalimassilia sp. TaxID=1714350 RepID=UPI0025EB14BD|nr:DUF5808 domain-containing protein [uncultured Senegalimassilia sp.]
MSNNEVQAIMLILGAFIPLVGLTMALMPRLQPRGEVFSVSVPTSAWDDPRIRRLMNRYVVIVIAATALFTVAALALCLMGNAKAFLAVVVVALLALMAIGYGLILRYRAKVQGLKRACGWVAQSQQHVATIGEGVERAPRPISLAWNWLYVPLVALTAAVVAVGYGSMPDAIPMHVDISGNVTDMVPKSPIVAAFPVALEVFLAAVFVFCHWMVLRSKKGLELGRPASSSWAYGMFAYAQTAFLLVMGLACTAACGLDMALAMIGIVSMGAAVAVIIGVALLCVVGSLIVGIKYGQSGSRVFRMEASDKLLFDDDRFWKLGMLYCNPNDASLFLPQRSGIGWTVNWGRPAVWAMMAAFALFVAAFIAICMAMVG